MECTWSRGPAFWSRRQTKAAKCRPMRVCRHLRSLLLVGGRHHHRQQVAKCIDGDVRLTALLSLVRVIARSCTAFRRGLQGPSVEDGRWRPGVPVLCHAEQFLQVLDDGFERASLKPSLGLIVDRVPGRELVGLELLPSREVQPTRLRRLLQNSIACRAHVSPSGT